MRAIASKVSFCVDDALGEHSITEMPANARFVGWQCGFELMVVAVWSYLPGVTLDIDEAEDIARDLLREKNWFEDPEADNPADFVL